MRRLHHIPLSPFCRKVRLVLAEKKVEVGLVEETPWAREYDFLRLNPAGRVPVFVDDGGTVVSDSAAIIEYLEDTRPDVPMMPAMPGPHVTSDERRAIARQRAEIRRLVAWFDDKMHREVTANLLDERVMKKVKGGGYPDSARVKAGLRNIATHLDYISWLLERNECLAGDRLTLADFTAAAHLSCLDYIDVVNWGSVPLVKEWYARIKSRPGFRSLLADRLPGMRPPDHYDDLDF
ncbi:glutathione S-transferase family protein [Rhodovulum sp. DZ06]|uniref:glutathione S-transferase family protein n=1 Tax=Rhodovulum sp. DZ06 TaxID=3425126 RepID=UPI003D336985